MTEHEAETCQQWRGMAGRMERLRAVGNGQVPGVAALAWRILTHNVRSQATDAALSRQVACTDGLGVGGPTTGD